jgi:Ca-activated chloride channel family protein
MIRCILATLLSIAFLWAGVPQAAAQEAPRTMIVMDGSGSMWGQINGRPKLQIARRAVAQLVRRLPPDMEVGLMAYGHRTEGDCGDIQVLVRPAAGTAPKIRRAVNQMKFQGKTPLAGALSEAAEALGYLDVPVTVVMVTDGLENCQMNPCKIAAELEADGFDFTAHVIGFGLSPKEGARVACIAKRTGGTYYPARNARALARALVKAMIADDEDSAIAQGIPEAESVAPGATDEAVAGTPAAVAFFRGAPVMLNVTLDEVGSIGIVAQSPAPQGFAADGTISDCQNQCEGDPLCAAWRFEPAGTVAGAQCTVFSYATALDYAETDPAKGQAAGMKVGAVQLVRPYVPTPVPVVVPEEADTAATDGIAVRIVPTGAPIDLSVLWQAIPLDDPDAEPVGATDAIMGEWQVQLLPGEYAIEGVATGYVFEDYIKVSQDAFRFEIVGFAAGEADADDSDDAVAMADEADLPDDVDSAETEGAVVVDPEGTLGLPGAGAATEAGYLCAATEPCGFSDAATGLVFALPPGWASDYPTLVPDPDGSLSATISMTMFGPEGSDGSVPTLLLNPAVWIDANGPCAVSAAGSLCVFGQGDAVTQAALELIVPRLVITTTPTPPDGPPTAPEQGDETAVTDAGTDPQDGLWSPSVAPVVISQCPEGIEAGLAPVIAALDAPRRITWDGVFEPARLGLDAALPGVAWQSAGPADWQGEAQPSAISGQPAFLLGVVRTNLTLTDSATIKGQFALTAFADGVGMVNLLNVGLAQCNVTADFTLTRSGG